MALAILIIISAIAFRGACSLMHYAETPEAVLHAPQWTQTVSGKRYVRWYAYAAIPMACYNGFAIEGFIGLLVAGVGSWLGMLLANLALRFNPGYQFMFFGAIHTIWTIINVMIVVGSGELPHDGGFY